MPDRSPGSVSVPLPPGLALRVHAPHKAGVIFNVQAGLPYLRSICLACPLRRMWIEHAHECYKNSSC